jgi:predicted RNase H-like nuclease (RuvC/YqgF family)
MKPDVLTLERLIRNHVNIKNSIAKLELSNLVNISGDDLVDALDNLDLETEEETQEYQRLKADYSEKVKEYEDFKEKYKGLQEENTNLKEITKDYQALISILKKAIL